MSARDELLEVLHHRYREAERSGKSRILDEFVSVTGYHRKHAIRMPRGSRSTEARKRGALNVMYGNEVQDAPVVFWEVSDRMCGKRLQVLLPSLVEAMKRHGHLALSEDVRAGVLAMSAATIDRRLRGVRAEPVASTAGVCFCRRWCGDGFRCGRGQTGGIRRPGSWRVTWSRTAVRSRAGVFCKCWSSRTSPGMDRIRPDPVPGTDPGAGDP